MNHSKSSCIFSISPTQQQPYLHHLYNHWRCWLCSLKNTFCWTEYNFDCWLFKWFTDRVTCPEVLKQASTLKDPHCWMQHVFAVVDTGFPGGTNLKGGANLLSLPNFLKRHENWTERGRASKILLCRSAADFISRSNMERIKLQTYLNSVNSTWNCKP